jgi:hypothetical protein
MKTNMDTKNNQQTEMTKIFEDMIGRATISQTEGMLDLSLDEKVKIDILDAFVQALEIDPMICSNRSKHIKHSDRHVSDDFAMNIAGRILLKEAGARALGCSRQDIKCHDEGLQDFYEEHNLGNFSFDELMKERSQNKMFGGQPHVIPIIRWRWNNGLIFLDYEGRVMTYVRDKILKDKMLTASIAVQEVQEVIKAVELMDSGFDMMIKGDVPFSKLPDIFQKTMRTMSKNRLTFDREAISVLGREKANKNED